MEKQYPAPRPRLRTTGGIVIGQGYTLTGRLPMAITDDPVRNISRQPAYEYSGHQIWGFPWRVSGGRFSVGPMVAPRTRMLAAEWSGAITGAGSQFWLLEEYTEDLIEVGGYYDRTGTATPTDDPRIIQLDYTNTTDPSVASLWGGVTDSTPGQVTAAWLLSVVKKENSGYYLCAPGLVFPHLGMPLVMPVYPDDFDTDHPL